MPEIFLSYLRIVEVESQIPGVGNGVGIVVALLDLEINLIMMLVKAFGYRVTVRRSEPGKVTTEAKPLVRLRFITPMPPN